MSEDEPGERSRRHLRARGALARYRDETARRAVLGRAAVLLDITEVGFWIFGSLSAFMGFCLVLFSGAELVQGLRSYRWPTASGKVVSSKTVVKPDEDGHAWYSPEVTYAYVVNGREYRSSRIDTTDASTSYTPRSIADRIAARYPVGREVKVWYKPGRPSYGVLNVGVSTITIVLLVLGFVTFLVGAGMRFIAGLCKHLAVREAAVFVIPFFLRPLFAERRGVAPPVGADAGAMGRDGRRGG